MSIFLTLTVLTVRDDSWLSRISPYSGLLFEEHWFTWYFKKRSKIGELIGELNFRHWQKADFWLVKTVPKVPEVPVRHGRLFKRRESVVNPTPILISTSPHLTWIPIPRIGPFWNHFHQNLVFRENLKKKKTYPPPSRLVMNFGHNLPSPTIVRPVSYRAKTSIYFNLKDSPSIKPN